MEKRGPTGIMHCVPNRSDMLLARRYPNESYCFSDLLSISDECDGTSKNSSRLRGFHSNNGMLLFQELEPFFYLGYQVPDNGFCLH